MYNGKSIKEYSDKELVEMAKENHMWLNAFSCINPTPEFLQGIGKEILQMIDNTKMSDSMGISPTIILTINKS